MKTRCQIAIYEKKPDDFNDFKALLYRHSDSYPKSVIQKVVYFLQEWKKKKGCIFPPRVGKEKGNWGITDYEYLGARLVQYLKHNDFVGTLKYGYSICKNFYGDIEYLYIIYPSVIKAYEMGIECFDKRYRLTNINKAKLIKKKEITTGAVN